MIEVPTRERLVTEAMRLFCEQGYRATSVAQIEAAAGLAPGSGALYHHFKSKEALLDAGIDRQLDRRRSMRDIRMLFRGVGDLRTDLTLLGRYLTAVIDEEQQFLTIAANTPGGQIHTPHRRIRRTAPRPARRPRRTGRSPRVLSSDLRDTCTPAGRGAGSRTHRGRDLGVHRTPECAMSALDDGTLGAREVTDLD